MAEGLQTCIICQKIIDVSASNSSEVGSKGLASLVTYSNLHSDNRLLDELTEIQKTPRKIYVHISCRRDYTNRKRLGKSDKKVEPRSSRRRSEADNFDFKSCCLFCGELATFDLKHPNRNKVHRCETLHGKQTILQKCEMRGDSWSEDVCRRLTDCIDLVASEAVYHKECRLKFFTDKNVEAPSTARKCPIGKQPQRYEYFEKLCLWLDEQVDLFTVSELYSKMQTISDGGEIYTRKWFRTKLEERYGDTIFFSDEAGKSPVVCFKDMASSILSDNWYKERKTNISEEKRRIIHAAASLIKSEARSTNYSADQYPSKSDIENYSDFLPSSLQYLMELLVKNNVKQASIGQCILKAMKPNSVIPPLQFGLGVEVVNAIGSKWLSNELSRLGFAVSYDEVIRFKQSVLVSKENGATLDGKAEFTQWVSDNVDHNIATIDGKGTFHGMGIISCSVGKTDNSTQRIKRLPKVMGVDYLPRDSAVQIHRYPYPAAHPLGNLTFLPLELLQPSMLRQSSEIDLLWHCASLLQGTHSEIRRPNWNGFMDKITTEKSHPDKTTVSMLPIIDMNPSDENCVYSTLLHVIKQAREMQIPTPCITMDQPLWAKAVEIATSQKLKIVVRLGGFHTLMSFVGSVGRLMEGSGLEILLETIYGRNTVTHIFSGKAISRALRGHFLVDSGLRLNLLRMITPDIVSEETLGCAHELSDGQEITKKDMSDICMLYEQVINKNIEPEDVEKSSVLKKVEQVFVRLRNSLAEKSRTAKLWLLYMDYVDVMKMFIKAERSGDWLGHLDAIQKMLPLFAATGHINYAKSARLYLQLMRGLKHNYPWLYEQFAKKSYHCVRRSDKYWAGLWTDLVIEQTMMRSIKSRGGLTRGSGMTDSVRLLWVSTLHECSSIRQAMSTVTGAVQRSSEQHVDLGAARIHRDSSDLDLITVWLDQFNPFETNDNNLRSLSNGLTATEGDGINCDQADIIGNDIQKNLDNTLIANAKIPRNKQLKSLQHLKQGIRINSETVPIDPSVLFTRLVVLLEREEHMEKYFNYELTPVPTSLFKDKFMRHPDKSSLAHALRDKITPINKGKESANAEKQHEISSCGSFIDIVEQPKMFHVLDGGALLHRVFWNGATYMDVIQQYRNYVKRRYGVCSIVFDGYQQQTTKDHEHLRRSLAYQSSADIDVKETIMVNQKQHTFLTNDNNKKKFIKLLSKYFKEDGHDVHLCDGDADTVIVDVALEFACGGKSVSIIAEDTDILVLLIYFWNTEMAEILMRSEAKKGCEEKVHDIAQLAQGLDRNIVKHLLFVHAWGGCDTTSATFNHGKSKVLKIVEKGRQDVLNICSVFDNSNASKEDIGKAGIQLFGILYGMYVRV